MKKLLCYLIFIITAVIVLPLLITRGCGTDAPSPGKLPAKESGETIRVYLVNEKKTVKMSLEDYIIGVVAAEMPASFEPEALKAQSVAARTYTLARRQGLYTSSDRAHPDADICTDSRHCQAWTSKDDAIKRWGIFKGYSYWTKIEKAVKATKGVVLTWQGMLANPVYHANSGGATENAEEVWTGAVVAYLKGMPSPGEEENSSYRNVINMSKVQVVESMKKAYADLKIKKEDLPKQMTVISRTAGGRVKEIKVGNRMLKGTEVRTALGLKSANFQIENSDKGMLKITTLGSGHGVGMSQCGANVMAKQGKTYVEILKYYYTGIEVGIIGE